MEVLLGKGPFIFYEVGGAGGIWGGSVTVLSPGSRDPFHLIPWFVFSLTVFTGEKGIIRLSLSDYFAGNLEVSRLINTPAKL